MQPSRRPKEGAARAMQGAPAQGTTLPPPAVPPSAQQPAVAMAALSAVAAGVESRDSKAECCML